MDPIWYKQNNISMDINVNGTGRIPPLEALPFWPFQVILVVLYSTTAVMSLSFNIITIIVLLKSSRMSTEIWKFLINLSVSDITMAIFSIPFTYTGFMLGRWIFPPILCPIVQFVQLCSVFVSVWTLTLIGFERYNAILHPLGSNPWIKQHKIKAIVVIWLIGIVIGSSQLIKSRAIPFEYNSNSYYDCRESWTDIGGKLYTMFIFSVTFLIPIMALIFVYTRIAVHLFKNEMPGIPDRLRDELRVNRNLKILRMLFTIVILFVICWLPIHIFSLLVWFYPNILNLKLKVEYFAYVGTYFFCHWISQFHSLVNPIVYCFMSENFRQDLYALVSKCYPRLSLFDGCKDGTVMTGSFTIETKSRRRNKCAEEYV